MLPTRTNFVCSALKHPFSNFGRLHLGSRRFAGVLFYLAVLVNSVSSLRVGPFLPTATTVLFHQHHHHHQSLVFGNSIAMAATASKNDDESGGGPPRSSSSKFEKKLQYNVDRFAKVLLDEQEQISTSNNKNPLLEWLKQSYGESPTNALRAENFQTLSPKEQMAQLKALLVWFRKEFPYYRDTCDHCHAKGCRFQGNDKPTVEEQSFSPWIDTTERSVCTKCQQITRFPRYLAALEIVRRKRGRCSEYSILLYRILRALGLQARWIVDWANHVWAEVWIDERWVHMDPCEAAIDTPLLYQGWGKNQTYIVAFEAPSRAADGGGYSKPPTVVDVTKDYTSDSWETIHKRRHDVGATKEDISASMKWANADLANFSLEELVSKLKGHRNENYC
jgi:hypothetical protein